MFKTIDTVPFDDQKMGTAGLRKKSVVYSKPNYVENFIQSIFDGIGGVAGKTYLVGGDGRYYNDEIIQKIIKLASGNMVKKLFIAKDGIMATPAGSKLVVITKSDGGFLLTASHNMAGPNGDNGIKYSENTGGQLQQNTSDKIYEITRTISKYHIFDYGKFDYSKIGKFQYGEMEIEVIDGIGDYVKMMSEIFDFEAIKKLFASGFTMKFDSMNAVTGPYAVKIFEEILGAKKGSVINSTPLPDFGGLHPDPNLVHAKQLLDIMNADDAPDFGAAADGDGDRYMILGKKFFVTPSDSIAIITDNYKLVPMYQNGIYGVAKSAATSTAVKRVADKHKIDFYETPTGWKFFVNLMNTNKITFCGEESFGSGSSHIREKDSIWAVLFWLNIIAKTGKSVEEVANAHWKEYGRSYYMRYDYEEIDSNVANDLMKNLLVKLPSLAGQKFGNFEVMKAYPFIYKDIVDNSSTQDGYVIEFLDKSRIVYRLSGTGSVGATLRMYLEKFEQKDVNQNLKEMIADLGLAGFQIAEVLSRTGKKIADVIT